MALLFCFTAYPPCPLWEVGVRLPCKREHTPESREHRPRWVLSGLAPSFLLPASCFPPVNPGFPGQFRANSRFFSRFRIRQSNPEIPTAGFRFCLDKEASLETAPAGGAVACKQVNQRAPPTGRSKISASNTSIVVKYQCVEDWSRIARTRGPLKRAVLYPVGTAMEQGACSTYINGPGRILIALISVESSRISKPFLCSF